jgi:hypothetical protein
MQRAWLSATAQEIAFQPTTVLPYLSARSGRKMARVSPMTRPSGCAPFIQGFRGLFASIRKEAGSRHFGRRSDGHPVDDLLSWPPPKGWERWAHENALAVT